jgi:hypothetical protein
MALAVARLVMADAEWDARESRVLRERFLPSIVRRTDYAQLVTLFEKVIGNDPSAVPALVGLLADQSESVAATSARALGRFSGSASAEALQRAYAEDARAVVRVGALEGLVRMRDSSAASLAREALTTTDPYVQAGGLGALQELGDPANGPAILAFVDANPDLADVDLFETLGKLGDVAGATTVRDRLAVEAKNKESSFDRRVAAARGLERMGQGDLAQGVLDAANAENTSKQFELLRGRITRLSKQHGVAIKDQIVLDTLLRDLNLPIRATQDEWGRPIRAQFVTAGVFHIVSDGPDRRSNSADDLSSAEAFDAYVGRVFPDIFE